MNTLLKEVLHFRFEAAPPTIPAFMRVVGVIQGRIMNLFNKTSHEPPFWRGPSGMALATGALISAPPREHWGHVLGYCPYLLLTCSLMHLMHTTGHGGHGSDSQDSGRTHNDMK